MQKKLAYFRTRLVEPCVTALAYFNVSPETLGVPQLLRLTGRLSKREGRLCKRLKKTSVSYDSFEGTSNALQEETAVRRFTREQGLLQKNQQHLQDHQLQQRGASPAPPSAAAAAAEDDGQPQPLTWDRALAALVSGATEADKAARTKFLSAASDWLLMLLLPLWEDFRETTLVGLL